MFGRPCPPRRWRRPGQGALARRSRPQSRRHATVASGRPMPFRCRYCVSILGAKGADTIVGDLHALLRLVSYFIRRISAAGGCATCHMAQVVPVAVPGEQYSVCAAVGCCCQVLRLKEDNAWRHHVLVIGASLVFSFICVPVVAGLWGWLLWSGRARLSTSSRSFT